MKLTAGATFDKSTLKFDGFIDLGQFTDEKDKNTIGDHALVMFQPFKGK